MKQLYLFCILILATSVLFGQSSYRTVTIKQIQQVPLDSLHIADSLQNTVTSRWTALVSPLNVPPAVKAETVEVVAQVIVPPKVITYNANGWTLMVRDTGATSDDWTNIFVHPLVTGDSSDFAANGFLTLERGDVVRLRGTIGEFPTNSMNSLTQFNLIKGQTFTAIDTKPLPPVTQKNTSDFITGNWLSGGKVKYTTGEPYEGAYVTLTNLTVTGTWSPGSGRTNVTLVDQSGNTIYEYDVSSWFTTLASRKYTSADFNYTPPPFGGTVDTLKGVIWQVSGAQSNAGFFISPIYPGDMTVGTSLPYILTHRRNAVTLGVSDTAYISVKAAKGPAPAYGLLGVYFYKKFNNGPWIKDSIMGPKADSTYLWKILPQPANTFVNYYFVAVDSSLNRKVYANSASGNIANDTSAGFFFYTVLDRPYTIHDLQYTPYTNGRTAYLGATGVTVSGIVTADSGDIAIDPISTFGTTAWYIQTSDQPWNGIWISGADTILSGLKRGDSVTVTGDVRQLNDVVTQLYNIRYPVTVNSHNNTVPSPVVLTTGTFKSSVGGGNPSSRQWEGMLVRFNNVAVTDIYPYFSDPTEYEVSDGSGGIIVRRDGVNRFSNSPGDTTLGKTIVRVGNTLSYIQGVVYYTHNRYNICPRTDADFGVLTSVEQPKQPVVPTSFSLRQNYPNPFNPATLIEYDIVNIGPVTLRVYNLVGQEIRTLVNDYRAVGHYVARFDAGSLPSGTYFYRLQSGRDVQIKKMILIR